MLEKAECIFPLDTRRRFNVDTTSYDVVLRRIDVETMSFVYGVTLKHVPFFQFSGPGDNIFVFYTGLGGPGFVAFPTGEVLYFFS